MATKKFIIEVDEGRTMCFECPFNISNCGEEKYDVLDCRKYDLSTIKIKEYENK